MKKSILIISLIVSSFTLAFGQFTLPSLPYAYNALEPYIDAETMRIHYNNHHKTYVDNLNKALENYPNLFQQPVEELIRNLNTLPSDIQMAVRNNGGGHYNHSLFWTVLAPARSTLMSDDLKRQIDRSFGNVYEFQKQFKKAATDRFGSGWVWLIVDYDGNLVITSTPNQDNPLMMAASKRGTPVLGLDVWEHAYYLKYQSKRADYIDAFWEVVNWNEVEKRINEVL